MLARLMRAVAFLTILSRLPSHAECCHHRRFGRHARSRQEPTHRSAPHYVPQSVICTSKPSTVLLCCYASAEGPGQKKKGRIQKVNRRQPGIHGYIGMPEHHTPHARARHACGTHSHGRPSISFRQYSPPPTSIPVRLRRHATHHAVRGGEARRAARLPDIHILNASRDG